MKRAVVLAVVLAMAVSVVYAQETSVPPLINYQGMLADANGNPMTATKKLTFNIYDAPIGGSKIWGPQVFNTVPLINGRFNVILGTTDNNGRKITDAFGAKERYLGFTVDGNSEIVPRQQILSTPYAIQAENAVKANSALEAEHAAIADVASTVQGSVLYINPNDGNVGIGTDTPGKKLEINGTLGFTGGQGPFCIFAKKCPNGWVNKDSAGFIVPYIHNCPYAHGGELWPGGWRWCIPQLCCNE